MVDQPELESLPAGQSVDIDLGSQGVVSVDLDNLDPDPNDVVELMREAKSSPWLWTRFASEYWKKGLLSEAEEICRHAIEAVGEYGGPGSMWPLYSFMANIELSKARKAPMSILNTAQKDIFKDDAVKESHYKEVAGFLNKAASSGEEAGDVANFQLLTNLTRSLYQLSKKSLDEALQGFNNVISIYPSNIPALLGKARIFYARREWPSALTHFQKILIIAPKSHPDPRIGIGLCLWAMGQKDKARSAWERSVELNPEQWASQLLLGLDDMNASRDNLRSDDERHFRYASASQHLQKAFRVNNTSAAAANALSDFFLRRSDMSKALKLAERAVQYADTVTLLSDGHLRLARVLHTDGRMALAGKHYRSAMEGQRANVLASLGLAQVQLKSGEVPAAIHTLDTLLQPPNQKNCFEATTMLASLRTNPRPGVSSTEVSQDRQKAKEMYEQIWKLLETAENSSTPEAIRATRILRKDVDMYLEIARLWQYDNLDKVSSALREAIRFGELTNKSDGRIINNMAVLTHLDGHFNEARAQYEDALRLCSSSTEHAYSSEEISTTILYNLGRVYEEQNDIEMARGAYEKLLERHPEYTDARIRLAQILKDMNLINEAHEILKLALASQSTNSNLRAYYTYFLLQSHLVRPAKDFVFATLKDHDKHDLYSLCAAGYIMYQQARESRDVSPEGIKARRRNFERSVELYEKALSLDPLCAVAAQGLAIVTAEDALGTFGTASGADEGRQRIADAREALDVFAKIRETFIDGSVYANMGHCYYARDEFERAIECYETASKKFYNQQNVPVLLCLSRTQYAKATKDQSYAHMRIALDYAQRALHLIPYDKAVLYNIAMIEQKATEMLFSLEPSKRSLGDLRRGIEHAEHAQSLFSVLASDKASVLPYSKDMADQRKKYGDSMLRKADEHIAIQEAYEADSKEKAELARQRRLEEKERMMVLERERVEKIRKDAEELASQRRKANEEVKVWTAAAYAVESDEEREKKSKKGRKTKTENESGDEAGNGEEPKKRRRGKLKKMDSSTMGETLPVGDEDEALFSGEESGDKPKKRIPKKRVVRDEEEEEVREGPRRKMIKSKETISDSDEAMD